MSDRYPASDGAPAPASGEDQVLRSLTADDSFRVITAITTDTVRKAVAAQDAQGETARWLGELMTGAVLIREAVSPERRVQVLVKDRDGRTLLVADANPTGWNRGLVGARGQPHADVGRFAVIEVLYTLPNDVLQQGIVPLPDGADVSVGLMTYMQESEQILTTIATRTIVDHDTTIRAAGGYLVQVMPGISGGALETMTQALESFTSLDELLSHGGATPDQLRSALLGSIQAREMARGPLRFGCNCDRGRILRGLATLGDDDLEEMIADGDSLEIQCDACGKHYGITTEELMALLDRRHPQDADN